jgi:uncharacterized protein YegJ (DUF2314 family)
LADASLAEVLRGPFPLDWPVSPAEARARRIRAQDPEFARATAEARRRWPEFVRSFVQHDPREPRRFTVKIGVREGEVCENLWFWVRAIDGDLVDVELDTDPIYLRGIECGARRRCRVIDVLDWVVIAPDGSTTGGFTVARNPNGAP